MRLRSNASREVIESLKDSKSAQAPQEDLNQAVVIDVYFQMNASNSRQVISRSI